MDQRHPAHHVLHLVGLEVADKVDLGPLIGAFLQVGGELLHPVLPAYGDARPDGGPDCLLPLGLGGGQQGDLGGVPPGGPGGLVQLGAHPGDVFL